MIESIMRYIRNYFPTGVYAQGDFTIENGAIDLSFVEDGDYIKIEGSKKGNDGVYKFPTSDLKDETFKGVVAQLAPPKEFITLCDEIEEWNSKNADAVTSPYQSESFGGYSYSKQVGASDWTSVFAERLRAWRKI